MPENDSTIQVQVDVPEIETPDPAPVEPVVTVVETGASNGNEAVVTETAIDHEGRLVRIETALLEVLAKLEENAQQTAVAQATADIAAEDSAEARHEVAELEAGEQEDSDDDEEPAREHPFYRSRKIFGKAD